MTGAPRNALCVGGVGGMPQKRLFLLSGACFIQDTSRSCFPEGVRKIAFQGISSDPSDNRYELFPDFIRKKDFVTRRGPVTAGYGGPGVNTSVWVVENVVSGLVLH